MCERAAYTCYHRTSPDSRPEGDPVGIDHRRLVRNFPGSDAFGQQNSRSALLSTSLLSAILLTPYGMIHTCVLTNNIRKELGMNFLSSPYLYGTDDP